MPRRAQWLHRLAEIVEVISQLDTPTVDRAAIQDLFRIRTRQARLLMRRFDGCYSSGGAIQLDRVRLVRQLEAMMNGPEFLFEERRYARVRERVAALRKERAARQEVTFPVKREMFEAKIADLPEGVTLEAGKVMVEYSSPEEALQKLFALSQAIANDFAAFAESVGRCEGS